MYATRHDPKIYPHTKFRIPTSYYIQICSRLDLARPEIRGQGHSDLETVGDSPGPKMYLHTKYGTATINMKWYRRSSVGAILVQELTPEIKITVAENSERHSMTPTYIHKLNLRVNMSYNMRHALNTIFCLLSVSYFVGELICCLHTRQLGRWYYYSETNVRLLGDILNS